MSIYDEIKEERERQLAEKNYSRSHDDTHTDEELAAAAAAYACPVDGVVEMNAGGKLMSFRLRKALWPWGGEPKTCERRKDLIKSAALLVAEIERVDRAKHD